MHRQGVEIPLLENLGFKNGGERKDGERDRVGGRARQSRPSPAISAPGGEAPATNPESGETQSEPKSLAEPRATSRLQRR